MALSKAQRNSLIEDAGVDPARFTLDDSHEFGFWLSHAQSESLFTLSGSTRSNWFGSKRVGTDPIQEWEVPPELPGN